MGREIVSKSDISFTRKQREELVAELRDLATEVVGTDLEPRGRTEITARRLAEGVLRLLGRNNG